MWFVRKGSSDDWQDLVRQPDISLDPFLFERHFVKLTRGMVLFWPKLPAA